MLTLMHKLNKIFNFLNKYLYLLTFSSWVLNNITYFKSNKFFNILYNIIKMILFIGIIFSISIIVYFTDFNPGLNILQYDLLEPYIEIIKHSYDKLVNYFNSLLDNFKGPQINIENEIKSGIKSGIKEALEEVIDELETESKMKSDNLIKQFIIASSVLFSFYLFIYLPSDINTVDINQYNSLNQLFINLKISIIDIFTSKPGTPPSSPTISPPISPGEASTYFRSPVSESIPTVTPNSPVTNVQTINEYINQSVSTDVNGITVGKMVETTNILALALGEEESNLIKNHCNDRIKRIID